MENIRRVTDLVAHKLVEDDDQDHETQPCQAAVEEVVPLERIVQV